MKYNLLELTQDVLSSLSSDEVDSISDSPESMQVATMIRQKYFDIISRLPLPEHEQLVQLDPSADGSAPVLMYVPDGISNIQWLKYYDSNVLDSVSTVSTHGVNTDITSGGWTATSSTSNTIGTGTKVFTVAAGLNITAGQACVATATTGNSMSGTVVSYTGTVLTITVTSVTGSGTFSSWSIVQNLGSLAPPGYLYVNILPVAEFLKIVDGFNLSESGVSQFTFKDTNNNFNGNYVFNFRSDRQPQFCTIISNYYVIFDSYDNTQDDTLQAEKTMAWGTVIPTFSMTDTFIPNLAEEQFPLLLNEVKALAFFELKQQPHQLAMQETKRGWSNIQKNKAIANRPTYFDEIPNFGRFGRGGWGAPNIFKSRGFDRP